MGVVYKGLDPKINRHVALKVIRSIMSFRIDLLPYKSAKLVFMRRTAITLLITFAVLLGSAGVS
jgi:hypothetical protein